MDWVIKLSVTLPLVVAVTIGVVFLRQHLIKRFYYNLDLARQQGYDSGKRLISTMGIKDASQHIEENISNIDELTDAYHEGRMLAISNHLYKTCLGV